MGTDFDDLLAEIEGTGWYQKRLVYFLLGPLFFVVPFAFLHQIFVLAQPSKLILKKVCFHMVQNFGVFHLKSSFVVKVLSELQTKSKTTISCFWHLSINSAALSAN